MAFTRKMLKAMSIDDEKIDEIIEAHREVVDALKEDRDKYKADAEKFIDTKKELDDLKKTVDSGDSYKERYEQEHKDFEDYKASIKAEQAKAAKADAYKALLKEAKVSDDWIDDIVKFTEVDDIQLGDDGKIVDADKRIEGIKSKYAKYIVTESTRGANTETPPTNVGGKKMSNAEIFKKDEHGRYVLTAQERQKAIAENLNQ